MALARLQKGSKPSDILYRICTMIFHYLVPDCDRDLCGFSMRMTLIVIGNWAILTEKGIRQSQHSRKKYRFRMK